MKVEFELNLDNNGNPCIKFRHYDKDASFEQRALKLLIDGIKEHGAELRHVSGYADTNGGSWESYELGVAKK